MGAMREIQIPDIGDFKNVDVSEVLVAAGDTVRAEQSLITVESDKSSMEIPSPVGGVIKELRVKVGDKVSKGSLILLLDEVADAAPAAATPAPVAATPSSGVSPAPQVVTPPPVVAPIPRPEPVPFEPDTRSGSIKAHASPSEIGRAHV